MLMPLTDLLNRWRTSPNTARSITAWQVDPPRPGQYAPFPPDLHPRLVTILQAQGISRLYTHQAETWQAVQAGEHPVIVTGTASGKTLAYNLPVLHHLLDRPGTRALYLFPTKALAQDQADTLTGLLAAANLPPQTIATYDGDTPQSRRPAIRQNVRLLITNPDMLHTGILPHHTRWADFFQHLRFVVIDEMHVYRGIFGAHVANVLRRLKRIAAFYGAAPQFILTSATIANPDELAARLVELPVTVISRDAAPRGRRDFLIYNPPVVRPELGLRRSALSEAVRLAGELARHAGQTLVFSRTRRGAEMLVSYLRTATADFLPAEAIRGYRSGYLPRHRREIEAGLRRGQVRLAAATSALELGVDIGGMAAVVMVGFPGTLAAARQQAGRAGRREGEAVAVMVASANPLDQFLARHPEYFFDRPPEQALINPDNLLILWMHLRCALFELPFHRGDSFGRLPPETVAELLDALSQTGEAHPTGSRWCWMADKYPAEDVSLRNASPERVVLQTVADDQPTIIGEVDRESAAWMVHPQAIYLHEGQTYRVDSLDLDTQVASLQPVDTDYFTEPKTETTVQLVELHRQAGAPGGKKFLGDVLVVRRVVGYKKFRWFTHEHLGDGQVDLPPTELPTTGYWLALAPELVDELRAQGEWSNDPIDYGPNWPAQRRQARARDGYVCQMCGAPERGQAHHVHHKIPFRRFSSYREANRLSNLITLCPTCHRRAEQAVRMRSGLAGVAFVLGHLAPLFLMCDRGDIAVHADAASPLAEGRPAVVVYDMAPGGIGFADRLFDLHVELMRRSLEVVSHCPCPDGCPACVGPAGEDGIGGKRPALALLQKLARESV